MIWGSPYLRNSHKTVNVGKLVKCRSCIYRGLDSKKSEPPSPPPTTMAWLLGKHAIASTWGEPRDAHSTAISDCEPSDRISSPIAVFSLWHYRQSQNGSEVSRCLTRCFKLFQAQRKKIYLPIRQAGPVFSLHSADASNAR